MSEQKNHGPPIPRLESSYLMFKKEVSLWSVTTTVEKKRQAGTIIFSLPDKAKAEALEIPLAELQDGRTFEVDGENKTMSGIECLLEVLDKIYLEDIAKEKFKCYDAFRRLTRPENQSIRDFTLEFEKAVKRLDEHEIKLPSAVLAYELLRSANVSEYQYSVAVAIVGELNYENMRDTVRKITELPRPQKSPVETQIKIVKEEDSYFVDHQEEFNSIENDVCQEVYYNQFNRGRSRYRQPRRGYRNYSSNGRGNYQRNPEGQKRPGKKTNPRDPNGHIMPCRVCKSIYHFADQCPDASHQATFYNENIALLQNTPAVKQNVSTMEQFTKDNFGLAVLDSGCNTTVCGAQWLDVYLNSLSKSDLGKVTREKSEMQFKFGDNSPSKSDILCKFPGEVCGKKVCIAAQVVSDQIPLLISKQTMKKASMILDFKNDTVEAFGSKQKLIFTNSGHCSIPLSSKNTKEEVCACAVDNIILTSMNDNDQERKTILNNIPKIHKQYCHPTAESLKSLIKTAGKYTPQIGSEIDKVTNSCEICVRYKQPGRKPIVCMPLAKDFNDTVAMDLKVYDKNKGIYLQHQIDHRTRFSTVKVIRSKDKEEVVSSVFTHWINIFGPPKKFMTDNGGEYVNSSFMDLCEKLNVHVVTTGAEAPWSNGLVERHHALLSSCITKIQEDTQCSIEIAAAWAVHAKNCLSNIDGFSPYQLLFGKNPSLTSVIDPYKTSPTTVEDESPSETVARNIMAIYSARRKQIEMETASKIKQAIKAQTRDVYSENIKSSDLVYYKRNDCKRWKGPATVIGTEGKLVFVRHGGYVVRCHRVHVIKVNDLYTKDKPDISGHDPLTHETPTDNCKNAFNTARLMMSNDIANGLPPKETLCPASPQRNGMIEESQVIEPCDQEAIQSTDVDLEDNQILDVRKEQKLCEVKSRLENKKLEVTVKQKDPFYIEKLKEIDNWKKNGVFEEVNVNEMEMNDNCPVTTRWVMSESGGKKKARLVARGFEEAPLKSTETVSPTCRKESLRLLFSIAASKDWPLKSVDIASAFLQGKPIERTVYVLPPKEFYKPGVVWKLHKCVYGLSDAARMWYSNVREQTNKAGLTKGLYDDALFFSVNNDMLSGMMTVHVDDFVFAGTQLFQDKIKEHLLDGFEVKSEESSVFDYLGLEVSQDLILHEISVGQEKYIQELKPITIDKARKNNKTSPLTSSEYVQYRKGVGQLLWLSIQSRPDISFTVCQLSNHLKEPNIDDLNWYNKTVKQLKTEDSVPLVFNKIPDLDKGMKLLTYSDASFGNLANNGSQCGYLIFLADANETVKNLISWKSVRLERVCSSTLTAESLALFKAVDHAMLIQQILKQLMGSVNAEIKIHCYVDNKGLLELINKTKDPTEKRLITTMASIRESVDRQEIEVSFIPTKKMPADVLTKKSASGLVLKSYLEME